MKLRPMVWPAAIIAGLVAIAADAHAASLVGRGVAFALGFLALVVLTGWSGQINLHVAAVGIGWGAYVAAGLAANGVPALAAIVFAPIVVAPVAAVVGLVAVRLRGLELAIATLAVGLVFEQMAFQSLGRWLSPSTAGTQFESSALIMARPPGFAGDRAFALLALGVLALWVGVVALTARGRIGRTMRAVRDREVVAEARGVGVFGWRVGAFVASIAIAAAGGAVFAAQSGAVTPGSFSFSLSLQMFAIAMLAGITRLEGAIAGAAIMIVVQEAAAIPGLSWLSGDLADLFFGVGLIAVLAAHARRARPADAVELTADETPVREPARTVPVAFAPTVLRVSGLHLSFGSRRVLAGVELRVGEGEIVGLIGGNGAGKTTLFDCITGLVTPDAGQVFLDGRDITDAAPHRRARLGLARTFQAVEVFEGLSLEEGLMVVASLRSPDRSDEALRRRARVALGEVGLTELAPADPATLPMATLRLAEIAGALVSEPRLVLLDEPLAGLDAAERTRVLAAIGRLRSDGRAVLIVEHDHVSVAKVADRVYELEGGVARERPGVEAEPVHRRIGRRVPVAARG